MRLAKDERVGVRIAAHLKSQIDRDAAAAGRTFSEQIRHELEESRKPRLIPVHDLSHGVAVAPLIAVLVGLVLVALVLGVWIGWLIF